MEHSDRPLMDKQLLDRFFREGHEESFNALVQRYKLRLFNLAFRVLYDTHAAEDMVQRVFVRLVKRRDELINLQSPQSWLYLTTLNLSLNARKSMERRKKREQVGEISTRPESPREAAIRAELRRDLDSALASLKNSLRIPIVLRYLLGLSYAEAGKVMDLPSDTVRKRVNKGLKLLRKLLVARGLAVPVVAVEAGLRTIPAKEASASFLTSASSIIKCASTAGIAGSAAGTATTVINGGLIVTAKSKIVIGVGAAIVLLAGSLIYIAQKSADRSRTTSPRAERPTLPPKDDSVAEGERKEDEGLPPVPATEISKEPVEVEDFDIAGKVIDKADKPIEGALVEVNLFTSGDSRRLTHRTEGDGKFGFRCPDAKGYSLLVSREDYVSVRKNFSPPEKDIVVMMLIGGAIEGKVVDAVTSEPLDVFRILRVPYLREPPPEQEIYPPDKGRPFWNPEGRFRVSGLEKGTYTLTSIAEGYAPSSLEGIKVDLEETITGVVIQQQPEGGIHGHVVDAMGRPIEGAKIVQKKTGLAELREMYLQVLTTSDAKGEFEIGGLPAGTFTLEARHGDYGAAERKVEVNKGEITEAVEFQLFQGGMISGMVLAEADSLPIAGATLRLRVGPSTYSSFRAGGTVTESDQSGRFRFPNLTPGTYYLTASAADSAPETIDDVILEENKAVKDLIIKLSQGGSLVGTVRDHAGKPVAHAHVGAVSPLMQKHVRTDEEGNYAIRNLKEGNYSAGVSELTTRTLSGRMQNSVVEIENGKETRLDIVLGGPLKVYGKVTQSGEPQAGLEIVLMSSSKASAATKRYVRASGETDPNGDYEIGDLKSGEYRLMVMNPRIETQVTLADADVEKNIELPEGGMSGRVLDAETAKPIEGAKVGLQSRRARDLREAQSLKWGYYRRSDRTDSEGRYDFSVVEDGLYFVVAEKEGYAPQGTAAEVQNSQGPSDLDFFLSGGTTLRGRVTGSDSSRPVQEIFLSARDSNGAVVYSKNINLTPEGEYETAALSPGEHTMSVEAKGYAPATSKVKVVGGGDNRADFVLPGGGRLIVRVVDNRDTPVPGVQTNVLDKEGNYWWAFFTHTECTREEGVSIIPHISEGEYRIEVGALGYEDKLLSVTIREGDTTDRTVRLRKSR